MVVSLAIWDDTVGPSQECKIAKSYFDILPLVCRRFVAYILSLLSCGKLRNTTASPVSALEIVARCLLYLQAHTAASRTDGSFESRFSFWFSFFVYADRIGNWGQRRCPSD